MRTTRKRPLDTHARKIPARRPLEVHSTTRLEGQQVERLDTLARKLGLPRSEILRRALACGLAQAAKDPRILFDTEE